ncbi:MAG: hypothetical protein E3J72_10485 [Planctomycetota bacterium]|nr:MAG: hypothetical protein E3J72_10485 [Planctomycetota bacterium]
MKISLSLKLGIFVVLIFTLVISVLCLYRPLKFRFYEKDLIRTNAHLGYCAGIAEEGTRAIPYIIDWIGQENHVLRTGSIKILMLMLHNDIHSLDSNMPELRKAIANVIDKDRDWCRRFGEIIRSHSYPYVKNREVPRKYHRIYEKALSLLPPEILRGYGIEIYASARRR